jgi:hypothetical protein
MSRSNATSAEQEANSEFSVEYDYEIECCGVEQETVNTVEEFASESGIRTDKFAFTHSEQSTVDGPLLRIKGLDQESAEKLVRVLRDKGLSEIFDQDIVITILSDSS